MPGLQRIQSDAAAGSARVSGIHNQKTPGPDIINPTDIDEKILETLSMYDNRILTSAGYKVN